MKKSYMKPEVNEIEVAANQAVAACEIKTDDFKSVFVGYGVQWDGGRNMNGRCGPLYETLQEAVDANRGPVCPCYDMYNPDGTFLLSWEDYNTNGVFEQNRNGDNWQNVENWNLASALTNS